MIFLLWEKIKREVVSINVNRHGGFQVITLADNVEVSIPEADKFDWENPYRSISIKLK